MRMRIDWRARLAYAILLLCVFGKEDQANGRADHNQEMDQVLRSRSSDGFLSSALIDRNQARKKAKGTWNSALDLLKTSAHSLDDHTLHLEKQFSRLPNDIHRKPWVVLERDKPSQWLKFNKNSAQDHFASIKESLIQFNRDAEGLENALALDGSKAFERLSDTLDFKNPESGANNKMAHRIRAVLTDSKTSGTETWHGKNLDKTEGPHRKGNYAQIDNCESMCSLGTCLPSCVVEGHCLDVCKGPDTISGAWKTSRGVFVQIGKDGAVNWELGNAEFLHRPEFVHYKDDRQKDKIIKDPEGFERSLIYLWREDEGVMPGQPLMYHGHYNDVDEKITWLEDNDVWERVDKSRSSSDHW